MIPFFIAFICLLVGFGVCGLLGMLPHGLIEFCGRPFQ